MKTIVDSAVRIGTLLASIKVFEATPVTTATKRLVASDVTLENSYGQTH